MSLSLFLVAYAQIDWHDFVVVETVDYQPFEIGNFPPPTTPEEVGARILIQERIEEGEDIEMQLESDEEETPSRNVNNLHFVLFIYFCALLLGRRIKYNGGSHDEKNKW